ncbi:MAG: SRPBCC family protein [Rhodoplanes sp.]|uniref:SRPBCC family protein n=1 Tax=Rhodoplanes sp. TaxID=1968906 RepID=UPI0017D5BBD8|nr:SRPBCC family protein [Rhodoplanes sp.]NVO15825.1 SRPBCC family protein [Rhodoplanes sp.]
MSSADFRLVSDWNLAAPPELVWEALMRPAEWPTWWPAVTRAEVIAAGDPSGVGSCLQFEWKTALPYRLAFEVLTTRVEPLALIEGEARGALVGTGRWLLTPTRSGTRLRYDWTVRVTAPGLRLVAPIARKAFVWNHGIVMRQGEAGLARWLARR